MKLYISGPMTDLKDYNRMAFNQAADALSAEGYQVINSADIDLGKGASWQDYMRESLRRMADADGVALLSGWRRSRGARTEEHVARSLGIPVCHLNVWLASSHEGATK